MKKVLFVGSTVADVVIRTPGLPCRGEDINIFSQQVSLGGCAYNAFHTARHAGTAECVLFSPVGTGVWGDWVRSALAREGVMSAAPSSDEANGCCYCLVEPDGERSFLCEHGAEYRFEAQWFEQLDTEWDAVYLCGLEVEEPTGGVILDWLENHPPRRLFFAPGPRIMHIQPEKMARVMSLGAVFHLNETELCRFTREDDIARAAEMVARLSGSDVIVTLGPRGAYVLESGAGTYVAGRPAVVMDTIGAGDAHIGAIIALEAGGTSLTQAVARANLVSAAVVGQPGACLAPELIRNLIGGI